MMEIKKIDILSTAKLCACLVGGIYLVAGVFISFVVSILGIPVMQSFDVLSLGSALLATLLVSMVMGAVCFIFSAIFAWLYNILAKLIGGIKIDLQPAKNPIVKFENLDKFVSQKNETLSSTSHEVRNSNTPQSEIDKIIKDKIGERDTFSN